MNSTLIPTILKSIDGNTFPVTSGVIYEILHSRYRHKREEYLNLSKSEEFKDRQNRRRHVNGRRSDVSKVTNR